RHVDKRVLKLRYDQSTEYSRLMFQNEYDPTRYEPSIGGQHEAPPRKGAPPSCHASLATGWERRDEPMTAALGVGGRRVPGNRDGERSAAPGTAHHVDVAAVRLGNPFADREAQSRARALSGACARRVGTPEAVADGRAIPGRE